MWSSAALERRSQWRFDAILLRSQLVYLSGACQLNICLRGILRGHVEECVEEEQGQRGHLYSPAAQLTCRATSFLKTVEGHFIFYYFIFISSVICAAGLAPLHQQE